jgi:hypothetical protein
MTVNALHVRRGVEQLCSASNLRLELAKPRGGQRTRVVYTWATARLQEFEFVQLGLLHDDLRSDNSRTIDHEFDMFWHIFCVGGRDRAASVSISINCVNYFDIFRQSLGANPR